VCFLTVHARKVISWVSALRFGKGRVTCASCALRVGVGFARFILMALDMPMVLEVKRANGVADGRALSNASACRSCTCRQGDGGFDASPSWEMWRSLKACSMCLRSAAAITRGLRLGCARPPWAAPSRNGSGREILNPVGGRGHSGRPMRGRGSAGCVDEIGGSVPRGVGANAHRRP
jgi:hypothetical protein